MKQFKQWALSGVGFLLCLTPSLCARADFDIQALLGEESSDIDLNASNPLLEKWLSVRPRLTVTEQNMLLGASPKEWESANIREWLNSSESSVSYTALAPTYASESGFLSDQNFTAAEREGIAITRHGGGWQYSLDSNINDTTYISQRGVAHNDYLYNDRVFILHYTDLMNYLERNDQLMSVNKKYYSSYLQQTTNKLAKYDYVVNSGYYNSGYAGTNVLYTSVLNTVKGREGQNIVPALSLKPTYVLADGTVAKDLTLGQTVTFGRYNGEPIEWQVINISDAGYPLLWSTRILMVKEYDAQGDTNPQKSAYINYNTYDVDIASGTGQNKSWETQSLVTSVPTLQILNESILTTPTNDTQITIELKAVDSSGIREIRLPDGTVVKGDTATYTITENGEYDILVENNQGVVGVRHIITKAINTPAEVAITTDKDDGSKWSNKPVTVSVSASNNGIYTKSASGNSYTYQGPRTSAFPDWMPLGGKRIHVKGTFYNTITDADIETYNLNMNATFTLRLNYVQYTINSKGHTYPIFKEFSLKELKEKGSIEIDEVYTIPDNVYSGLNVSTYLMNNNSPYMGTGYSFGFSNFSYEILDKDDLKIEAITLPDGTVVNGDSTTYTISEEGSYTFSVQDNRGKVTSKTIDLAIDLVHPTVVATYDTAQTNETLAITLTATDDLSGIKTIKLPNGESRTNTTEGQPLTVVYNIVENGTYTFEITDFAGNKTTKTLVVANIDKTAPVIAGYSGVPSGWAESATIRISAADVGLGLHETPYSFDGGLTWQSSPEKTFLESTTVTLQVRDKVGNYSEKQTLPLIQIDRHPPVLTQEPVSDRLTTQVVNLVFEFQDLDSGIASYVTPDGATHIPSDPRAPIRIVYPVSENGDYVVTVTDLAGHVSTQTVPIRQIEAQDSQTDSQTHLDYKIETLDGQLVQGWTSIADGGTLSFSQEQQVKLTARVTDEVQKTTSQYTLIQVDKTNPIIHYAVSKEYGQTLRARFTLNIVEAGGSGLAKTEYSLDNGATWVPISGNEFTLLGNITEPVITGQIRVTDQAGNQGVTDFVVTFDVAGPTLTLTAVNQAWTNQDVIITAIASDESGLKSYTLPDGTVVQVSGTPQTLTITSPATEIGHYTFKFEDAVGNTTTQSIFVDLIDKTNPLVDIQNPSGGSWTSDSVIVQISGGN